MSLYGAVQEAERTGKELLVSSGALDSSGELLITTDFANIDAVVATVEKTTAPTTLVLTSEVDGSDVTIHGWKATAADDTAMIASDAGETVNVIVLGRRRK